VRLQQQPAKVLALLLLRAGELVTRDEIRSAVWGQDTYVNFDQGLNFCIKEIRAALGDDADEPRFVETLPRRGYRFVAPVEAVTDRPRPLLEPADAPRAPLPRPKRLAALAWLLLPAAAVVALLLWPSRPRRAASPSGRVTIAVLPFENLSGEPAQDSLAEGLTEELIAEFGRLAPRRLGVIARATAMQYKGRAQAVERIGRELGVDYVVEGGVRRGGERVRITVSLIKVGDRTQLFSEAYEREAKDLLALQREVAQQLARRIEIALSP
jgi:TolB-like protein/DNA-binding winged helix-turn-helix (wHTH) protein